jgi:hypothetical protein
MTAELTFGAVPPDLVSVVWPDAEPLLAPAIATADGKFTSVDIYNRLLTGELLLWIAAEDMAPVAAVTTRIIRYPGCNGMAMDWIGGSRMREWLPLAQKTLMRYAKQNDCTHLEGYGRKGWSRWLRRFGWKPDYIAYRMDLDHG